MQAEMALSHGVTIASRFVMPSSIERVMTLLHFVVYRYNMQKKERRKKQCEDKTRAVRARENRKKVIAKMRQRLNKTV
jgi:hypothetical protein